MTHLEASILDTRAGYWPQTTNEALDWDYDVPYFLSATGLPINETEVFTWRYHIDAGGGLWDVHFVTAENMGTYVKFDDITESSGVTTSSLPSDSWYCGTGLGSNHMHLRERCIHHFNNSVFEVTRPSTVSVTDFDNFREMIRGIDIGQSNKFHVLHQIDVLQGLQSYGLSGYKYNTASSAPLIWLIKTVVEYDGVLTEVLRRVVDSVLYEVATELVDTIVSSNSSVFLPDQGKTTLLLNALLVPVETFDSAEGEYSHTKCQIYSDKDEPLGVAYIYDQHGSLGLAWKFAVEYDADEFGIINGGTADYIIESVTMLENISNEGDLEA